MDPQVEVEGRPSRLSQQPGVLERHRRDAHDLAAKAGHEQPVVVEVPGPAVIGSPAEAELELPALDRQPLERQAGPVVSLGVVLFDDRLAVSAPGRRSPPR
jgi:hypothetical protein